MTEHANISMALAKLEEFLRHGARVVITEHNQIAVYAADGNPLCYGDTLEKLLVGILFAYCNEYNYHGSKHGN